VANTLGADSGRGAVVARWDEGVSKLPGGVHGGEFFDSTAANRRYSDFRSSKGEGPRPTVVRVHHGPALCLAERSPKEEPCTGKLVHVMEQHNAQVG
jgi:hypothetical protein